ncbi:ABC transporter ATP-binding protein [Gudongella sp. DL1XJH-153]|uniref:ABC transporter ATP-binding protein n=1 Tax=Gudongella sp. DL1XJH-153 TaxID=3409804 RepID=UPI003BB5AECF
MKSFLTIKEYFLEHKKYYIIGVLWLIVIDAVQLVVPQILRRLTDDLQYGNLDKDKLMLYAFLIVATGLFIGVGRYFWRIYLIGSSREIEFKIRNKLFSHLLTLSPNYFNTHKTGDLMAHATNDINAVRMALGPGTIMIVDSVFLLIFSLFMMVRTTNLSLTAASVFTLPIIILLVTKFGRIIYRKFKIVQEAFSNLSDITQESFSGIRVIKSFVQEKLVSTNFESVNENNFNRNMELVKVHGGFHPLLQLISSISYLVIIFYGGRQVINGTISLGDFVAFNSYLGIIIWPTRALGMVINVLQRGAASLDRLNVIFNESSEIKEKENPIPLRPFRGNIEFRNVSFAYPNTKHNALTNVSIKVPEGKTLAITGRTGSGKSTIANLLLRLYDITGGEVLVDGSDIRDVSLDDLRKHIGFVPQDNFLFSQSIRDNIALAYDKPPADSEIAEASRLAQLYDNIMDFPQKFDTVIGERGVTLSGGQKQRLSIARALIKKPPMLIMDDSLSAVDTETEEKILEGIKGFSKDITTLLISHRISTVKGADEIIFLDDGKVVERGTHDELLLAEGEYFELYQRQLLEEQVSSKEDKNG